MLKINNERKEDVPFGSLKIGDVFIDPDDNDVCLKINDYDEEDNAFSFDKCVPFRLDEDDLIIQVHEAILTIK